MKNVLGKSEELLQVLKVVAPGTELREGLENVLKARTGALIVVGDSEEVMKIADGGFKINEDFSPARLYELAKMDGAIVLSKDAKKILLANTQLVPDSSINTAETGTRHRSSERVAKQTGELVICISQRRNVITIFKGNMRYVIKSSLFFPNGCTIFSQPMDNFLPDQNGIFQPDTFPQYELLQYFK